MKKEKKNIGLMVIVVVLIILVLGLTGYLVYDKILNNKDAVEKDAVKNETDTTEKVEENKEELNVASDEVQNLYKKLRFDEITSCMNYTNIKNYYFKSETITDELKIFLGLLNISSVDNYFKEMDENTLEITSSDLTNSLNSMFENSKLSSKNIDITINARQIRYDQANDKYVLKQSVGGCTIAPYYDVLLKSAKKTNDSIILNVKGFYWNVEEVNGEFEFFLYKDDTLTTKISTEGTRDETKQKQMVNNNESLLNTYEFLFKKSSDGTYKLSSYKLSK